MRGVSASKNYPQKFRADTVVSRYMPPVFRAADKESVIPSTIALKRAINFQYGIPLLGTILLFFLIRC
jgi:hypothetical protein